MRIEEHKLKKTNGILENLDKNQNTVLVCDSQNHNQMMANLHKEISSRFRKICMISVQTPFAKFMKNLQDGGIDSSNYCFIDCISAKCAETKDSGQCMYISSPIALTELAIAIEKMKERHDMDLIVLDNISALLVYNNEMTVLRFLHSITTSVRKTETKVVYSVLQENRKEFMADLSLFADAVIRI